MSVYYVLTYKSILGLAYLFVEKIVDTIYLVILPIRLQIANQNRTQMLLDLNVNYFPQMCQFVLVKDYNKENNAQITKCV